MPNLKYPLWLEEGRTTVFFSGIGIVFGLVLGYIISLLFGFVAPLALVFGGGGGLLLGGALDIWTHVQDARKQ